MNDTTTPAERQRMAVDATMARLAGILMSADTEADVWPLIVGLRAVLTTPAWEALAESVGLCPVHAIDAAICADDGDPSCEAGRAAAPAIPTGTYHAECDRCGKVHEATYHHEGRFGEGHIFAVTCPEDGLTAWHTTEGLTDWNGGRA